MIRRLIILLLIVGCAFGQVPNSDYKYPYTGGVTMSYLPTDGNFAISLNMEAKDSSLKDISFIGRWGYTPIEGNYEDHTGTLGTVNFLEDRDDGHISKGKNYAVGVGTLISLKKSMDGIFIGGGLVYNKVTYYQALYDSYEILGNNGKYYIDGTKPEESKMGLFCELLFISHKNNFNVSIIKFLAIDGDVLMVKI